MSKYYLLIREIDYMSKKYKLLPPESMKVGSLNIIVRRVQALRDIPLHNVKAGDLGGYIECFQGKKNPRRVLSHKGSCWIGGEAVVMGLVRITGNALVTDNVIVKACEESIKYLTDELYAHTNFGKRCHILDDAVIKGNAVVSLVYRYSDNPFTRVSGNTVISDNANVLLYSRTIMTDSVVKDNAIVIQEQPGLIDESNFSGDSYYESIRWRNDYKIICQNFSISDSARITTKRIDGATFRDCSFSGDASITVKGNIDDITLNTGNYTYFTQEMYETTFKKQYDSSIDNPIAGESTSKLSVYKDRLDIVESEFNAYKHDIVRLIKYPMMGDLSNESVLNFVHALKQAKSFYEKKDELELLDAVLNTEKLFLLAESKAQIALDTRMGEKEQSKLRTAKNLLAIAYNDQSSDNEKTISCQRVIKELKGIVPLGDKLIDNLRISVGLKELEA